ncbi:MAG: hypothetical protein COA33_010125 [Fluviicola sp.]|nr:hypothetical protein [Fluviicola sp.]
MKTIQLLIFLTGTAASFSQDTIFTQRHENGIYTERYEIEGKGDYSIYFVEEHRKKLYLKDEYIKKIVKKNGEVILNPNYKEHDFVIFGTNLYTAAIEETSEFTFSEDSLAYYYNKLTKLSFSGVNLKQVKGIKNESIEFIGEINVFSSENKPKVYLSLHLSFTKNKVVARFSDFLFIEKGALKQGVTYRDILSLDKFPPGIIRYESLYINSNKKRRRYLLSKVRTEITGLTDKISEKQIPDSTIKYNDLVILKSGVRHEANIHSDNEDSVHYFISHQGVPEKRHIRKKDIYFLKYEDQFGQILGHEYQKKQGNYIILDKNTLYLEFYAGYSEISVTTQAYSIDPTATLSTIRTTTSQFITGAKIGKRKYFNTSMLYYSPGIHIALQGQFERGRISSSSSMSILSGYSSIWKIKPSHGLEINCDLGIELMDWEIAPNSASLFSKESTLGTSYGVIIAPSLRYRYKGVAIGISYSTFIDAFSAKKNNVRKESLLLSLSIIF